MLEHRGEVTIEGANPALVEKGAEELPPLTHKGLARLGFLVVPKLADD
jgi:hypothetical protein